MSSYRFAPSTALRTACATLCLLGLTAHAAARTSVGAPAQLRGRLKTAATQAGVPNYVRTCANQVQRTYLNPSGARQLQAVEGVLSNRANTLEICHMGSSRANHTLGIFNRQFVHVQFLNGTNNWRLRSWGGGTLRPSSSKFYSAVIQLTDTEATNLRQQLKRGFDRQGSPGQAGPRWENGNLGRAYNRSLNCVSFFSEMPIGANGEPLWRVVGLQSSYSGNPRGLLTALEQQANERVAAICVYGPQLQGFAQNPNQNKLTF